MIVALIVGVVVVLVVPPVVWWSVTQVVPRALDSMGLLGRHALEAHELRLQRIEEAIDALAVQVEHLAQAQRALADDRERVPRDRALR